jgi:2-polyprenyl-3-methyl-5-hydroxy-6-metoxy-1,4-benzoquinol methylase
MPDWIVRWNQALREQHQLLFDYEKKSIKDKFALKVNCPVCGMDHATLWFEKDMFRWYRCTNCSMVYMNPRLNNKATHDFYNSLANSIYNESKFDQITETSDFDDKANKANLELINKINRDRKGNLLEIGSGKGYFLKKSMEAGYQVIGVELNQKNCDFSRKLLGEEDLIRDIDLLAANFNEESFDVIYMRDLIQHIPNPRELFQECFRLGKPGCILFIGTHNIAGLIARIVGSRYTPVFGFMEPNHYSPTSITKLLNTAGFTVQQISYQSIDCTVSEILGYFHNSSFTTIFPEQVPSLQRWVLKTLQWPFLHPPLKYLDEFLLPSFSTLVNQGSWMNVIARKQ